MKTQAAMTVKIVGVHQELCVMTCGHMRPSCVFVAQIQACIYVTIQSVVIDHVCDRVNYVCDMYFVHLYDGTS